MGYEALFASAIFCMSVATTTYFILWVLMMSIVYLLFWLEWATPAFPTPWILSWIPFDLGAATIRELDPIIDYYNNNNDTILGVSEEEFIWTWLWIYFILSLYVSPSDPNFWNYFFLILFYYYYLINVTNIVSPGLPVLATNSNMPVSSVNFDSANLYPTSTDAINLKQQAAIIENFLIENCGLDTSKIIHILKKQSIDNMFELPSISDLQQSSSQSKIHRYVNTAKVWEDILLVANLYGNSDRFKFYLNRVYSNRDRYPEIIRSGIEKVYALNRFENISFAISVPTSLNAKYIVNTSTINTNSANNNNINNNTNLS